MSDHRGYSYALVRKINMADPEHLGVQLGKYCVENDVSVQHIADAMDVSRTAVYAWFEGKSRPTGAVKEKILAFISKPGVG